MIPLLFQRIPSLPTRFDCELGSLQFEFSGDCSGGETPVPIPNTAVKPPSADGTARVSVWESRSSPGINFAKRPLASPGALVLAAEGAGAGQGDGSVVRCGRWGGEAGGAF